MNDRLYQGALIALALGFSLAFLLIVVPPLIQNPDIIGAFAAGFVNPYASGYSLDVFFCWAALLVLVLYEARALHIRHGWVCLLLGIVPGVAVGLSLYLLLRHRQLQYRKGQEGQVQATGAAE